MNYTTVCRFHGGSAKQVREAAYRKIVLASEVVIDGILAIAHDEEAPHAVRLAALRDLADRAGLAPTQKVSLERAEVPSEVLDLISSVRDALPEIEGEVIDEAIAPEITDDSSTPEDFDTGAYDDSSTTVLSLEMG